MRRYLTLSVVVGLGVAFLVTGCFKKSSEQINISSNPSLETSTPAEDLTQLPSSVTNTNQAPSQVLEPLPIEPAPVTQGAPASIVEAPAAAPAAVVETSQAVTHNQKIQAALKAAGLYSGKVDGKIGPKTKKAIEAFQAQHNLKADGKVGPKTWALMEGYLNGTAQQQAPVSAAKSTAAPAENQ